MKILNTKGITFDDVLLVPQYSDLLSRSEADPRTQIGNLKLSIPIIAANMDSISGIEMALAMGKLGGAAILHRYEKPEVIVEWLKRLAFEGLPAIPSIGVKEVDLAWAKIYRAYTDCICLDIAHGHSAAGIQTLQALKQFNFKTTIAGNVATFQGAYRLSKYANVIKVGIGPGSVCETRGVTGHGIPQLTAIKDAYYGAGENGATIIADGGMNSSGDIVKALAMGAHAVMTGSLVAGTDECNMPGLYRGMASAQAQMSWFGQLHNAAAEGIEQKISTRGPIRAVVAQLAGGIRSGMSYSGARTLAELYEKAVFMPVTSSTIHENNTRKI